MYKQKHGDCLVPRSKEKQNLGKWVDTNIRQQFQRGELSHEHIVMLDKIGFVWDTKNQKTDSHWTIRYNELVAYKQQHGNCIVPLNKANRNLWNWMNNNVRQRFKRGKLSDERVAELDKIVNK